jgi:uncharacterized repeat protein (TIGR01451 family)
MQLPGVSVNRAIVGLSLCLLGPATTLFAAANLYITKTGPGGVRPGEQLTYTIQVGNAGPDAVRDGVVTDAGPPGLTLVSVAGDCKGLPCDLGSIAFGDTRTLTATYLVPPGYAGANPIVNTASVSSSVPDDFPSDNTASASTALTEVRGFYTLPPCRVADTRGAVGVPIGGPALAAGEQRPIDVRERCGLPGNAVGVSYNITITGPTSAGNLRLYPQGPPSLSSVINYVSGQTRANNGIVQIPASGVIVAQCDQASGSVHLILDVNGYFTSTDEVPTPKGKNVRIRPAPEVEVTFDEVTTGGSTSARVIEFLDDRGIRPPDKDLRDFFPAGSPERALLPSVIIPSFVRALPKGGPNGPPIFVLAIIDTDAAFARTAEFHGLESFRLGWDPPCVNTTDPTLEPRTFYAREAPKNEPFLVEELPYENPVFVDTSSGCGSNKASGWNFSLYLTGRDARTPRDVAFFMLTSLDEVLSTFGNFITDAVVAGNLVAEVQAALRDLDINPPAARASMDDFIVIVDTNPAAFDNSIRNLSGELVARAQSARYMIGKIPPP